MDQTKRLDALLSDRGFCSRRKVEDFLHGNNVLLNARKVIASGTRVNMDKDELVINGKKLELKIDEKELVYYALNKTKGILSAASDNAKRKTVTEFVPNKVRVYPVGRLDEQSTGLILLTNDGDLAHKLTHPSFHIPKVYLVWVVGVPSEKRLDKIRDGMKLKEGWAKPTKVTNLKSSPKRTLIEVTLNEGKNHQIRRMFSRVGINIVELKRVSIGSLELEHLGLGKYRELTKNELAKLKKEVAAQVEEVQRTSE